MLNPSDMSTASCFLRQKQSPELFFKKVFLRHYVTFKVRKFESLFYKVNACLQRTITCTELQAE